MQGVQKKPWKARPQGMFIYPYSQFNPYAQWNQWQPMNNASFPNQPWQQGWRGNPFGNIGNQPSLMHPYTMSYNQYLAPIQQAQYPIQQQKVPTQMNPHPKMQTSPLQLLPAQNPTRPT